MTKKGADKNVNKNVRSGYFDQYNDSKIAVYFSVEVYWTLAS